MKLPFSFKNNIDGRKKQMWHWPSCKHPKTLSFRASDEVIKTVNSVYFDPTDEIETPETWFTTSSSESTRSDGEESCEAVLRELVLAERLFFEPDETRSIIKKNENNNNLLPFEDSMAMAMESNDPYVDFKKSMEEMVESHGLKEWECLEELLGWYLKVNGKNNHGFIVGAFVDLLAGMVPSSTTTKSNICNCDSDSFASCISSPSSPLSPLLENEGTNGEDNIVIS